MAVGDGIRCGNPGFGASGIAMTAAGYYFTVRYAWNVMLKEVPKNKVIGARSEYTVETEHSAPALTNMAFACELAFKSLLPETDRERIHKLKDLYEKLESQYQTDIKGRAVGELKLADDSMFYTKLNECSNNFVQWRYFFEPGNSGIQGHFDFMRVMIEEVFDMYGVDYWS